MPYRSPVRGGSDGLRRRQYVHDCHRRNGGGNTGSRGQQPYQRDRGSSHGSDSSDDAYDSTDDDSRSQSRGHMRQHGRNRRELDIETDNVDLPRKAMSYRTAPDSQKKHIVERIQVVVKGMIFRKMKFITSEAMFNRAMKIVLETEDPDDEDEFVRIYKTCVVGSINSKRSTCEQAGGRIVKELLVRKGYGEGDVNEPYSLVTLCKLRQGVTPHDKEAFRWFIGEFVASVSGRKVWGRKKYYYRVSEAVIDKGSEELVVTVSDEAFAILLYENYIEKWITRYHKEQQGEKVDKRITGKYTSSVMDHCLYGGWSAEGVARFNELCGIVDRDRRSADAKKAEDEVLLALRREKFPDSAENEIVIEPEEARGRRRTLPEVVEAFCEL